MCVLLFIKEFSFSVEIRSLDSEMQTLVYENYNKFISATDTIRKVTDTQNSCEFVQMNPQLSREKCVDLKTILPNCRKVRRIGY